MLRKCALYGVAAAVLLVLIVTAVGYALPQGHVATVERVVAGAPAEVFERIADVRRYPEWRANVTRVEVLATTPLTWREHEGGDSVTYEVVERLAPERLVVRIADPDLPFGGTWTYELRPEGDGTRVSITERGEVYNPVFRFVSRFLLSQTASMEQVLGAL